MHPLPTLVQRVPAALKLCTAVVDSLVCVAVFAGRSERRGWLVLQQLRQLGEVGGDPPRPVAANGFPSTFPCRPTRAYMRIIGAAEGAIMPTIITAHMTNT